VRLSVVLPQQEIGTNGPAIRVWAQTLESWGIDEIETFDHVLGGAADHWQDGPPKGFAQVPYTTADPFHEPLTLLAYLAAATERIGLATSVLILPQRQTALVAKQCAELDLLSGGRFRLGVGIGWNHVEYQALGVDFRERGRRLDEQIDVLRALWAEPVLTYDGRWHQIDRAGLNPLPPGGGIPIWIGGMSDAAVARVARAGDGWPLNVDVTDPQATKAPERLARAAEAAGRPRESIALSGWIKLPGKSPAEWEREAEQWAALGVDQVGVITRGAGTGPEPHLELVERFLSRSAAPLHAATTA
jgi:probable F420-dependent oxidoreductase